MEILVVLLVVPVMMTVVLEVLSAALLIILILVYVEISIVDIINELELVLAEVELFKIYYQSWLLLACNLFTVSLPSSPVATNLGYCCPVTP